MKTAKEVREAKSSLITQKKMIESLMQDEGFKLLMERLTRLADSSKESIHSATDWNDFVAKKAYHDGLMALSREVDAFISRGKSAENTLKI